MAGLTFPLIATDKASDVFLRVAGAADKASGSTERLGKSIADMGVAEQRSVQTAVRHAEAISTVGKAMTDTATQSTSVQRATLGVVAAQDRLTKAMESGRASVAQLADAQASLIGAEERLVAAQREVAASSTMAAKAQRDAAVESEGLAGAMSGTVRMAGELGVVFGAFEIAKKAIDIGKEAASYQRSMVQIGNLTGTTKTQVAALSSTLLNMAGKVAQSPEDLATSAYHAESSLRKLGATAPQIYATVEAAAKGATIGSADLEQTTNALTATMASGIVPFSQAGKAMGALLSIVGSGDMSVNDLNAALSTGLLVTMKTFGVSLKDTGAALAVFGDNNLRGQDAATRLRMAVQDIAKPAANAGDVLAKIGLTTGQLRSSLENNGLNGALTLLKSKLDAAGISGKQIGPFLEDAFTKRAGAGLAILLTRMDQFREAESQIGKGSASFGQQWQNVTQTASYALKSLGTEIEAEGIKIAQGATPYVTQLVKALSVALPAAVDIAVGAAKPFIVAFKLGASILGPVAQAIASIAGSARPVGPALKIAASGALSLYAAMKLLAGARAVGVLLSTGLAKIGPAALTAASNVSSLGRNIKAVAAGEKALSGGAMIGIFAAVGAAAYGAGRGISDLTEKNNYFGKSMDDSANTAKNFTAALNASGGALDNSVRTTVAAQIQSEGFATQVEKSGISLKELTDGLTGSSAQFLALVQHMNAAGASANGVGYAVLQLRAQYDASSKSGADLASVTKSTASAQASAAGSAGHQASAQAQAAAAEKAAAAQAKILDNALQNLAQTQLGAATSEDQFREGILSLTKTIKSNHDQLNQNTQAGLANRDALLNMLSSAVSLANAQRKNGASIDSVTSSLQGNVQQLIQTAVHAGLSRSAVQALVRQMGLTPRQIATKFNLTGVGSAITALQRAKDMLDAIHNKTVAVTVVTQAHGPGESNTIGGHHAAGGSVRDGWFTVGEQGGHSNSWELGHKRGSQVQIFSNAQSRAMTGMDRVPGFASGTEKNNELAIAALLRSLGATKAGIAGFLGNTAVESHFSSHAWNAGEGAKNFQQWEGSRGAMLDKIAAKLNVSSFSQTAGLAMIKRELQHGYTATLNVLRHATSARAAAAYVDTHYERSSGSTHGERMNDAARIMASGVLSNVNKIVSRSYPHLRDGAPGSVGGPSAKLPSDTWRLVVPAASAFAKAAAKTVTGLVARSVRPADTSITGLAGQVSYQSSKATNLTQASMKARNVYSQEAAHVATLTKQLTNLRLADSKSVDALRAHATALSNDAHQASERASAMPAHTKAQKAAKAAAEASAQALHDQATAASQNATAVGRANAQQVAQLEKLQQAASAAASKAKDAWSAAGSAAKSAQEAAESAAKALVDSLQSQADALVQAVQGFQSTITSGLTQGTDLATLWGTVTSAQSDATDQLTTANQNLADAQQAVADAQAAITQAMPDTSSLVAAQNAAAQAQAQFTQAHSTLLAAQSAVAAGAGTPAQYAALTAAQQHQSDTLTALAAANSDLASAQQAVSQASGPTQDDIDALTTAQTNLAAATTAAATAASNAAANNGSYANLQAQFNATLAATQNFAGDLTKLTSEGAGQDLVSQIAAMGAASGDALAQQLLAAGPSGIAALQKSMTDIQNVAGKEADSLSKGFYSAGANSLMQLVSGMEKQFPALQAALAPMVAQLQAMFTFTPVVVAPGGSSATSSTGSSTKVITVGKATTLGAFAAAQGVKLDAIDALNAKYSHATAPTAIAAGTKITIPGFAGGVQNYAGGLAYVHADELVSLPRGSNVHTKTETRNIFANDDVVAELREIRAQLADAPQATGAAVGSASIAGYRAAGSAQARNARRAARKSGPYRT